MNEKLATQEFEEDQRQARAAGLQRLMADPMVKFVLSQIPPGPDDALSAVISKSFDAGFDAGNGSAIGSVMKTVIKGLVEDRKPGRY